MLRLDKKHINMFRMFINSSITSVYSSKLRDFGGGRIMLLKLSAKVCFENSKINNFLLNCDYKSDFYETEEGTVYYDYNIIKNCIDPQFDIEKYLINSSPIKKIEIYGRLIPPNDLKDISRYNKKLFINNNLTDDLFLFYCENGEHYAFVFENFLCLLSLYKSYEDFLVYFGNEKDEAEYRLNYTIE